jgi:hypothetical protein
MGTGDAIQLAASGSVGLAKLVATCAPVPGLLPALEVACAIALLCQNVVANKYGSSFDSVPPYSNHSPRAAARQLSDRCNQMIEAISDEHDSWPSGKLEDAVRQAEMYVQ